MKKLLITTLTAATVLFSGTSFAAGSASLALSPSSGSYNVGNTINVGVYENGSDVNTVTVSLSYDTSKLQLLSTNCAGVFSNQIGSGANITCYVSPGNPAVSGSQLVANASFKALANGTAAVSFGGGSVIASNGTNIWNGSTFGGSYTISTPATTPTNPSQPTTGGSTGTGSTGTSGSNSSNSTAPANNSNAKATTSNKAQTNDSTTATGAVAGDSTVANQSGNQANAANTQLATYTTSDGHLGLTVGIIGVIAALVMTGGAYWHMNGRKPLNFAFVKALVPVKK